NREIRLEIGALDIHMRDARPVAARYLIARPDHMPPCPHLDLRRPVQAGQQLGYIKRETSERPYFRLQRNGLLGAHAIERDSAGRYRRGVTVLNPEHDAFVG